MSTKSMSKRLSRLEEKLIADELRFKRNRQRGLYPLERLMLQHICGTDKYKLGADISDASGFMGPFTFGHRKWTDAQYCVTWMALKGLEEQGYVTWAGASRALGKQGWHGGLWKPSEAGRAAAQKQAA